MSAVSEAGIIQPHSSVPGLTGEYFAMLRLLGQGESLFEEVDLRALGYECVDLVEDWVVNEEGMFSDPLIKLRACIKLNCQITPYDE